MSVEPLRPLLLPQNRKLRHLRGISLRNLTFSRPRGRTTDDAALNRTPAKLEALREAPPLHHALSSEDLRPPAGRRRSTVMSLAHANATTRQKRFGDMFDSRLAEVFFSLHVEGEDEPVYISETADRATNFDFQFFDLAELDSTITRAPRVTIKVWTRRLEKWCLLLEDEVDLRALNWLGSLQGVHFPPNSLIFHMIDGIYSLELSSKPPLPKSASSMPTSSYNALMKLATLDNSIQDALATHQLLTQHINELLKREVKNEVPDTEDRLALANKYLAQQRRAVAAAKKRNEDLKASIAARRKAIVQGRAAQEKAARDVENAKEQLAQSKILLTQTREQIRGQRRRICEDLSRIFNITPIPQAPPLCFQICSLPLPNTDYDQSLKSNHTKYNPNLSDSSSEDVLSAALGHVAQLTDALQYYLSVPLPYPIRVFGSRSTIRDDISQLPDPQREFPLYVPRGGSSAQYRFDYAWFLLNKDIEALCASQGLKVVDIRHTLPNLKYLLYVCSAGTDEIPERKRGGIRGLWAGRVRSLNLSGTVLPDDASITSSFGGSRRGSDASDALGRQRGEELRRAVRENGGAFRVTGAGTPPLEEGEIKLTLRTKGLREGTAP